MRSHPQRFNFRPIQSRNALTCQGCLFSRNITLVIHISSPSQLGQKKKRPTRMIALIIYVRVTSHSNYSQTRWLKRKKKKKGNHFIIGSRFSGSRTWARLSWVHLLLHMAATEITQWNSVGGRAGQGDQMASLPGLAPRGHGWKAGHSWPEEVSRDPSSTMVSGLSDFL